ncbi:hypothetical protein [Streptomyces alfalfae]|uniref:Uncharacterized protein n=1 Tax=Streptomyces alfalfae TaxID=1642299 RepID=A0A7T4PNM8_9ACTN|nr:hypothetical protein [Streptomyces alfalfae]QQC87044.1 hypothetical protein I8755_00265 [Streptomyces alfalfae]QQC93459.1 hypothetical protein I8755_37935 [Streptomyces alfalfae]
MRSFLDAGEHACARQLADELAIFWEQCLAPHWSEIRDHAEADITHRAGITVRHGPGAAISLPARASRGGQPQRARPKRWAKYSGTPG